MFCFFQKSKFIPLHFVLPHGQNLWMKTLSDTKRVIFISGLDIPNVAVVVNFDRPRTPLDYKDRMRIIGKDVERSLVVTFCRYVDEMKFLMTDDELKAYRARPFEWTL